MFYRCAFNPASPQPVQPRRDLETPSNVSCEICGNPATMICACKPPLQGFCDGHFAGHRAKFPQADHYQVPAIRLGCIPTTYSDLEAFREKQKLIDQTLDRMRTSKQDLLRKKDETERIFEDLFQQLTTVREEEMEMLNVKIGEIEVKMSEFESNTEQLRYSFDYAPRSQLEYLVACQNSAELARRNLEFLRVEYPDLTEAKRALDHLVKISVNLKLFDQAPVVAPEEAKEAPAGDVLFPYVSSMRVVLFKLPRMDTYSKRDFSPRYRPKLDDCSQIVVLPGRKIFCVGGRESNFAYTIAADSAYVTEHRMTQKRASAGVVCASPYVFIFGGSFRDTDIRHIERYNHVNAVWAPIQALMTYGRCNFSPCAHEQKVYLLGGGPVKGEFYSEERDACYNFPFNMPSSGSALTFIARNKSVVFISGREMYRLVDNRIEPLHKPCDFEPSSHIAPIKIGDKLFFTDWTTEFRILAVNVANFNIEEVAKYQQGSL